MDTILMRNIRADLNRGEIQRAAQETGQTFIGTEAALKMAYGCGRDDLEAAITAVAEEMGMLAIIGGLDGNYPGEWFFANVRYDEPVKVNPFGPPTDIQPWKDHDADRLDALVNLDLDALRLIAWRVNVAQPDSPLWTPYGLALEIIIREDAFPYHRWEVPASHLVILSTTPPIHTDMTAYPRAIGEAEIGHAWFRVRDHVAALNNVADWRGEPGWEVRLIGITDGFCADRFTKELDATPF